MLIRVDLPNDATTEAMIRDMIMILSETYAYPDATIDQSPWTANKVVPIPGFRKCKFADMPGRPQRTVTVEPIDHAKSCDVCRYRSPDVLDLRAWLASRGPAAGVTGYGRTLVGVPIGRFRPEVPIDVDPRPARVPKSEADARPTAPPPGWNQDPVSLLMTLPTRDHRADRARPLLKNRAAAIQGQEGRLDTFVTFIDLIEGFGLTPRQAYKLVLKYWNPYCDPPWEPDELKQRCLSATEAVDPRKVGRQILYRGPGYRDVAISSEDDDTGPC
jgi:hypothetical protein